jgi:rhodanese-related sulfurtransferase
MSAMTWMRSSSAVVLAVACLSALAQANPPETPKSAKGLEVISVEQARRLVGKAAFYDMRSAVNYGRGHIEGATALPYGQKSALSESFDASQDSFNMAKLPKDKSVAVVFYSDGPTGWKSYKAAVLASRAGYKNVKWMREGTGGWVAKGYPLE